VNRIAVGLALAPVIVIASAGRALAQSPLPSSFGNSTFVGVLFWIFSLMTIGGAVFVITRRNLVAAVMGMVGTFFALAGLYLMLYASFLAVMQVLVYAGAIMVLFVFTVMILNRPEDEPWAVHGLFGKALAAIGLAYLLGRLAVVLWEVRPPSSLAVGPSPVSLGGGDLAAWGSVKSVGLSLFTDYLFPFEAVSIVLLIAVVGALAVTRRPTATVPAKQEADS